MKFVIVPYFTTFVFVIRYSAESFTWTAPPPAWTPSGADDVRTVKYPVLNGSTNVALRWNYTLGTGEFLSSTLWLLDATQIVFVGAQTVISDNRFDFKKSEVATLIIKNVSELEDVTIRCVIQTSRGNRKYYIRLEITVPPTVTSYSDNQIVKEGFNLTLFCNSTGKPAPNITWTRVSEDEVLFVGNPWRIVNINRTYSGTYRCNADNGVPSPVNSTISINVLFEPDDVTLVSYTTENNGCNMWVNLTCKSSEANPPVHNYVLLRNETDVGLSEKGTWIEKISPRETFVYKCQAYQQVDNVTSTNNISLSVKDLVPPVVKQIQNVTVQEGRNVSKECKVTAGTPTPAVFWENVKTGETLVRNPLIIINIRRNQSGKYRCIANNTCGIDFTTTFIDVQYGPDKVNFDIAPRGTVCRGSTVKFTCTADANPPVHTYVLFKNGTRVRTDKSGTWTKIMNSSGNFIFKCEAHSSKGTGTSKDTLLNVDVPPAVKQTLNITVKEGEKVTGECNLTAGTPPLNLFWQNVTTGQFVESGKQLTITNITRYQTEYECVANNTCGRASTTMFIDVKYGPLINPLKSETVTEGKHVAIPCLKNSGNPPAVVTWYKGNNTSGNEVTNSSTLEVQNAVPSDEGWYTCFAKNEVGNVSATYFLSVVRPVSSTIATSSRTTPAGPEECNCSCNDVLLKAIIGVLAFIILLLIAYIIWLHRRGVVGKQRTSGEDRGVYDNEIGLEDIEPGQHDSTKLTQSPAEYMDLLEASKDNRKAQSDGRDAAYAPLHPLTRSWEVLRHHVSIEKVIGKGAFGQVAKGTAVGLRGIPGITTVAIKMLKSNATESDKKDLMKELETMKQLKPHPYVIKLLGCITESEPLLVLIEYVPFGDLLGYLRKSRGLNDTYYKDPDIKPQTNLTSQQLMKFAWQIADGMSYLSSKFIIHRDLAARNVLVGQNETCKVTDFGMARDVQQENIYERKTKGRLPVKWTAYEALLYGKYTIKSDVWSYGVVLFEIFTIGGSPYPRMDGRKIANLLQQGYRMPKPQHVDDKLYQIMTNCWQNDPDARPTFNDLRDQLKGMETLHKKLVNMAMYDKQLYANVEDLLV